MARGGRDEPGAAGGAGAARSSTAATMLRLFGIPESEIAATLRAAAAAGIELERLEITTCLRRGEVEVVTRYEPDDAAGVRRVRRVRARAPRRHAVLRRRHDGRRAGRSRCCAARAARRSPSPSRAPAGCWRARLTERPGSSEVVRGGLVVYSNEAKVALAGVDAGADRARRRGLGGGRGGAGRRRARGARTPTSASGSPASPGPAAAREDKPVGLVWLSVSHRDGRRLTRSVTLPGGRADIRDRSTTVALHLVRRLLLAPRRAGERALRLFVALDLPGGGARGAGGVGERGGAAGGAARAAPRTCT